MFSGVSELIAGRFKTVLKPQIGMATTSDNTKKINMLATTTNAAKNNCEKGFRSLNAVNSIFENV
jgi:hypothetical protein